MASLLRPFMAIGLFSAMMLSMVNLAVADGGERKVKTKVTPVYPELARSMHISGTVNIEVTIAPNGTLKSTKVIGGSPLLVQSALDALKKWHFESGPGETTQVIQFNFQP